MPLIQFKADGNVFLNSSLQLDHMPLLYKADDEAGGGRLHAALKNRLDNEHF